MTSLRIGDVIEAQVARCEQYGLWLDYHELAVLVNIPEIAWTPIRHPADYTHVGCRVLAQIIHVNDEQQKYAGSIRALYPERDPWRVVDRWPPGARLPAVVTRLLPWGYGVEIDQGVPGVMRGHLGHFEVGSTLSVTVTNIDRERRRLEVAPAA